MEVCDTTIEMELYYVIQTFYIHIHFIVSVIVIQGLKLLSFSCDCFNFMQVKPLGFSVGKVI